ncbi:MAG: M14 family zinc carboxypeptidase [Gemmatimonadaceae bacterium]
MSRSPLIALAALLLTVPAVPASAAAQGASIPSPTAILGWAPGTDRKLPEWRQVTAYFQAIDKASPRVQLHVLGKTTLGRPFLAVFFSDSATLANLEHYRQMQRRLMDPRLRRAGELASLIAQGKNIVMITSSIHSTEVGGILTPMVLADRLARGDTPEARAILANTIVIMVPSLNPDGVDIVGDWYRATLGTPAEGTSPPELYHKYVGHDDNRDWYAFTQVETRYTVDSLYGRWDPEIVNDIHQQGGGAGRIFIPPYMDPVDPNIDPILTSGTNEMGMAMTWKLIADGFTGVANNASYDQWSPARQFSLYHRGIRILTETASARLATAVDVPFARLGTGRGYDARTATWNYPALWTGGRWGIGDIVRYQTEASWALLQQAARDRAPWLTSYATLGDRAMAADHPWTWDTIPSAYVIPRTQRDTTALRRLLWSLQHGQVEVRVTSGSLAADGRTFPTGSYVVLTRQPFGGYANTMLERQRYPNLFEYPGGPPKRPYDVTAQTLPLLFGVDVAAVRGVAPATGAPIAAVAEPPRTVTGLTGNGRHRVAIYRSYSAPMDEGWTRWLFDVNHVPFTSIVDRDVHAGDLARRFDVIILPDQNPRQIADGLRAPYPDSLRGGLGNTGAAALQAFVEAGGTLLAFNKASEYAIDAFHLPVTNVLAGVPNTDFYAPGSLLAVTLDRASPLTAGVTAPVPAVWFEASPAFQIADPTRARAVVRYPSTGDPLLSGWLLGGSTLNDKAAMVDVSMGRGHVVLYGFRPQYRGQSMATEPLIWGAIRQAPAGGR